MNWETPQHLDQTVHATLSTNTHFPIEMWQDINRQLEELILKKENFQKCKT